MQDINDYFKVRKDLYLFLGKVFYKEVSLDYIENLKKRIPILEAIANVSALDDLKVSCKSLSNVLANITQGDINALECAFANIFLSIGSSKGLPSVSPCESVYLSPRKLVMQEQRDEVFKIYCQNGMGIDEDFKEPEDHITAEMGFIALLSDKTQEFLNNNELKEADEQVKLQHNFLKEHLLKWIVSLSNDIYKYSSVEYYKVVSGVVANFVISDYRILESILSDELKEEASEN